jgi:outer membrane lipoprotein-sorting protein
MDHWRGLTSYGESTMTIHRPDWERSMTMKSWSKGDKISLVRVIEPKKDAGNGTLLNDNNMWTYTPRINRIIKVPSSMMSQSWMGSDFSNKDIAKSTDIIDQYDHELTGQEEKEGHVQYTVTSIPHEDAAVVWGKEVLVVRDDFVLIEQQFWDQDGVLVKKLEALEIAEMGGRAVATVLRMGKIDTPDEWTQLTTNHIEFDLELSDQMFTLSNLRNPRQ